VDKKSLLPPGAFVYFHGDMNIKEILQAALYIAILILMAWAGGQV
jgi:hypothetical protein